MTKISIVAIMALAVMVTACDKQNVSVDLTTDIVGTYKGTLSSDKLKGVSDATADVTKTGDNELEIHCYGDEIDTTFTQRLFENGDMVQMCTTGDDFYNEYGHEMMNQSDHHDMMNDRDGSSWVHHMDEEHDAGDEHYGSFDMDQHTFNYSFNIQSNGSSYTAKFIGVKEQ